MSCSTSRTTSTGGVGNGTEAEGGRIDAETAPNSRLMMPKSLMTPLPRQVMADTYPEPSSSKVPTAIPNNYCEVEEIPETLLLRRGKARCYHL
jgi:hypothetical protein